MARSIRLVRLYCQLALQLMLAGALTLFLQQIASAHELRPAIVTATIEASGHIEFRAAINLEARIAGIGPEHSNTTQSDKAPIYNQLRSSEPATLRKATIPIEDELVAGLDLVADDKPVALKLSAIDIPLAGDPSLSRTSTIVLSGRLPADATSLTWRADPGYGETVIRVVRAGEAKPFYSSLLAAGQRSPPIVLDGVVAQPVTTSLATYIVIGFEHIVPKGLDHILFVVGLFLLSPYLRQLLWQVTAFTFAHSVTLAMGIFGLVSVPSAIVEPLIAASIAFIAIENLFTDQLQRWRPAVVFGFGLLHGLGFAGVLPEVGLPRDQLAPALVGFNIGVEFGQLAVLAVCFLGVGFWLRRRQWYRRAVSMPASAAVAMIAMVWFVERIVTS